MALHTKFHCRKNINPDKALDHVKEVSSSAGHKLSRVAPESLARTEKDQTRGLIQRHVDPDFSKSTFPCIVYRSIVVISSVEIAPAIVQKTALELACNDMCD